MGRKESNQKRKKHKDFTSRHVLYFSDMQLLMLRIKKETPHFGLLVTVITLIESLLFMFVFCKSLVNCRMFHES